MHIILVQLFLVVATFFYLFFFFNHSIHFRARDRKASGSATFFFFFPFHICYHFPFSCFLKDHILTQSYNLLASAPGPVDAFEKNRTLAIFLTLSERDFPRVGCCVVTLCLVGAGPGVAAV